MEKGTVYSHEKKRTVAFYQSNHIKQHPKNTVNCQEMRNNYIRHEAPDKVWHSSDIDAMLEAHSCADALCDFCRTSAVQRDCLIADDLQK